MFKTSEDFLNSDEIVSFSKLEYLERELEELKEEEEHLKWIKSLSVTEKEWLIHQDIDRVLKLNYRTQAQAREYVKRCYLEIRNNVHSIDRDVISIKDRYDVLHDNTKREQEEETNQARA